MLQESQSVSLSQKDLFLPNCSFQVNNLSKTFHSQLLFEPQPLQITFDNLPQSQPLSQQIIDKTHKFSNLKQQTPTQVFPLKKSTQEQLQSTVSNYQIQKEPHKSQKGLRNLSIKVKQIVFESQPTSYKDVAENLVQELTQEEGRIQHCQKDEQNVRRRVYDALNVMIASKVFKKEGKKIKADSQTQILNKNLIQQRSIQKEQLNHKQTIVELKKKQLSDIIQKFKAANLLVQRNKSLESTLKQSLFHFPILIFSSQINNQIFIRDKKYLKILMKSKVNFIADLDVVKNLYLETIDLKYLIEECQNLFI